MFGDPLQVMFDWRGLAYEKSLFFLWFGKEGADARERLFARFA